MESIERSIEQLLEHDDEEISHIINIEIPNIEGFNSLLSDLGFSVSDTDDYELDERILEDTPVDVYSYILPHTNTRFSNSSLVKLVKRSGVLSTHDLSNDTIDFLTDIAYTRLKEVVEKALIMLDERGAKVLTHKDVVNALNVMGIKIISCIQ